MKRMLINATQQEELRVAMVDGQYLYDLDIEWPTRQRKKSNIYKGKIVRIEPSLEAVFVDYGEDRNGFLPFREISRDYLDPQVEVEEKSAIKDSLKEGQELIVQIDKEQRGTKGAALTTFIALAGRYLVMMPNNPRAGGVSRRVEGANRGYAREALSQLDMPEGSGVIARTAGADRPVEELQWDLDYLKQIWHAIEQANEDKPAPFLIYQDSNIITNALRDNFRNDIREILIDSPEVYEHAQDFIRQVMPHNLEKLKLYEGETPLFNRYQIESQVESAFRREVELPSGGSIVIDHTEAMIAIDINSGKATKGSDIEETALNTNLEAADEIARQLRLRDSGGLIVVDFIDMSISRNQREVETRLREALLIDKARTQTNKISRFGLLEMSRQRLRSSLGESSYHTCPRCNGQGNVRSIESLALSILRLIEEEAIKAGTSQVIAQVPVNIATFLLNEKRRAVSQIEKNHGTQVILLPNVTLETPHYEITREREDKNSQNGERSYTHASDFSADNKILKEEMTPTMKPAVSGVTHTSAAPTQSKPATQKVKKEQGLIKRLFSAIFNANKKTTKHAAKRQRPGKRSGHHAQGGNKSRRGSNRQQTGAQRKNNQAVKANTESNRSKAKPDSSAQRKNKDANKNEGQAQSGRRRGQRRGHRRLHNQADGAHDAAHDHKNQAKNTQSSDTNTVPTNAESTPQADKQSANMRDKPTVTE